MDDLDGWEKFYTRVVEEIGKGARRMLEEFGASLGDWLHAMLNWPTADWRDQLYLFVEHTRYYGLIIEPASIDAIRQLIESRVHGTGALEVAGPGPETTKSFREKVQAALELLDGEVAEWWKHEAGAIRSRDASSWFTFLRENHFSTIENGRPVVIVDRNYTVGQTAAAIVDEARRGWKESMKSSFIAYWLNRRDTAKRFGERQTGAFHEGAGFAGFVAELYYKTIAALTPAGEVVVTIDDVAENGLRWDQLLVALPLMAHFRKGVEVLTIKLPGGKQLRVTGEVLERLGKLDPTKRTKLIAKARAARTEEEGLAIIKRGVAGRRKAPARGKTPKRRLKIHPKRGPGKWTKVNESMSARARAYQTQISGRTGTAYVVHGVKFDGYTNGVLLDAKGPGYKNFVKKPGGIHPWPEKRFQEPFRNPGCR